MLIPKLSGELVSLVGLAFADAHRLRFEETVELLLVNLL